MYKSLIGTEGNITTKALLNHQVQRQKEKDNEIFMPIMDQNLPIKREVTYFEKQSIITI